MKNNTCAPLFVSVYDRPKHFKKCIESLEKNKESEKTLLYISSDGPRDDASRDKIVEIRSYIKSIRGFKRVIPFMAAENTGGQIRLDVKSIVRGSHDAYIRTEDDNVFSPFFLEFVNKGLFLYKNHKKVKAICGYSFPGIPSQVNSQLFLPAFNAWGYGIWSEKENDIQDRSAHKLLAEEVFKNLDLFNKINSYLPHIIPMLYKIMNENVYYFDAINSAFLFKNDHLCVYPNKSLVRNVGHDGSGANCTLNSIYQNQQISDHPISYIEDKEVEKSEEVARWLFYYFGGFFAAFPNYFLLLSHNSKNIAIANICNYFFKNFKKIDGLVNKMRHGES